MIQPFSNKNIAQPNIKPIVPMQNNQFPVKAPNLKLKEDTSKNYLVKCVSSFPLAIQMSKQELRIIHQRSKTQGKMGQNRFNQQTHNLSQPKIQPQQPMQMGLPKMNPNNVNMNQGSAPGVVVATGLNPFMKNGQANQFQKPNNPLGSIGQMNNNTFNRQNNMIPQSNTTPFHQPNNNNTIMFNNLNKGNPLLSNNNNNQNNRNPFIPNNQFQTYQNQYQSRHMFAATTNAQPTPGLVRQTSFGALADTQPNTNNPANPNQPFQQQNQSLNQQQNAGLFGVNNPNITTQQSGQTNQTPSFGNLGQPNQTQANLLGQTPKSQGLFGAQIGNQPQTIFPTTLPVSANQPQPQSAMSRLDANIKQLLESKPNLWNILVLDPQFKYGFNEQGRIYVKSVLQRIIDQNIVSGQTLNKIIIEIYKQMYGPQNFQKILENKKNQFKSFGQFKTKRNNQMIAKQLHDSNIKSVFPENIDNLGDDFYRSFKRSLAKSKDSKRFTDRDDQDDKFRLERKFYQVKKPSLQIKCKFIEIKKPVDSIKKSDQYSHGSLQKIAQNINEIRKQQRKKIMPTEEELPNIQGFTIIPSFETIKTFTRHQLLSVPKVTISNEWGSVRFKAPINLLNKNLKECIIINQKSVEIIDEEWKVREAEITFKKFANFLILSQEEQNELEEKIVSWCEKEKFELIKVDRDRGQVVIGI